MYASATAKTNPTRPAIIMTGSGQVVTFAEYEARANQLAHLFRQAGLKRLDHVAQYMENQSRFAEVGGAAERTGLYYTCVNAHLTAGEVAHIVNDSQARIVISSFAKREVAAELPKRCPKVERFLMLDGCVDGWEPYEVAVAAYPTTPVDDERLGTPMLYSSGTTGLPKGILRRLPDQHPSQPLDIVPMSIKLFGFREGMVYLSPAPLYHTAPQMSLSIMLRMGATNLVMERFDAEKFLETIERYRVTHTQVVPTMFIRLLRLPEEVRAKYDISSLESVVHAAAPCPIPVKEEILKWFGPIVSEYYAATEGHGLTWCSAAEWMAHKGSVGRALVGTVEIRDESGASCPLGEPGLVWFRGATNFEYHNDPEKTRASRDAKGTASTVGDIGYLNEHGYLFLTDRASLMINSGGVNIYPQECENLLASHDKVFDVAVIGVPHPELGEEVKAVIIPEPGTPPGPQLEEELIAYCRANLAHFKCPRSIDFVEQLPRMPSGKLYKRLIRDHYWKRGNAAAWHSRIIDDSHAS